MNAISTSSYQYEYLYNIDEKELRHFISPIVD